MAALKQSRLSAEAREALDLAVEKLALSGLSWDDAEELGMEALTAAQMGALGLKPLPGIKLNYLGPDGRPVTDWPKAKPFFRVRYLAEPVGFEALATAKPQRYDQLPGTICGVYFPQLQKGWPQILASASEPLIITEGELKAAASCKAGFPCLGLGGVYNWRALDKGLPVLPDLKRINWVGRNVYIVYDSDYLTNPMVLAALRELADWLVDEGAFPYVVTLPVLEAGKKTGLDDLLVAEGPDALGAALHIAIPLGLTQALFDLNAKYIYIREPGLILTQKTQGKISPAGFKEHLEATKTTYERLLRPDGTVSNKPVAAAPAWLAWPLRYQANRLTYSPGREQFMLPEAEWNSWRGWGCVPVKGDIKPFLKLIDHLFTGTEPEAKKWFLQWLAYPLQHPGTKLYSSCVFHGTKHGTGKSLVGYTMKRIYGVNFVEIKQGHLQGGFNSWAESKQFVMGDEITGSNKRGDSDLLKALITQDSIEINAKYIPTYIIPDCINYLFTSNHIDAFFLEDDDRRYGIFEVIVSPMEHKFYRDYAGIRAQPGWLDKPGPDGTTGAQHVFHYLLNLDMKGFHPSMAAFKTAARDRMIADAQSDLGSWVREVLNPTSANFPAPTGTNPLPILKELYNSTDLLAIYDPLDRKKVTAGGIGRELKKAGAFQVCDGSPLRLSDGSQARYYCVRNATFWRKAKAADCLKHIEGEEKPKRGKR